MELDNDIPPLHVDEHGVCRVSETRVTLESILTGFLQGETPEQIQEAFPAVPLSDVYAAIACYLKHRNQLDEAGGGWCPARIRAAGHLHAELSSKIGEDPVGVESDFLSPATTSALVTTLDDYNKGVIGPGHCPE